MGSDGSIDLERPRLTREQASVLLDIALDHARYLNRVLDALFENGGGSGCIDIDPIFL